MHQMASSLSSLESFPSLSSLSFEQHDGSDVDDVIDKSPRWRQSPVVGLQAQGDGNQANLDSHDPSTNSDDSAEDADADEPATTRRSKTPQRKRPLLREFKELRSRLEDEGTHQRTARQSHYQSVFARVDPPLLRTLHHLELSAVDLKRTDLDVLVANLFLLETLRSISLADNQLDDSCTKGIRTILSHEGLHHVDLSRNLLGRGVARMIADRLKHRLRIRSLDVSGNQRFFAFEDANDIAYSLAQGLASNNCITDFRVSLQIPQPHLERNQFILPTSTSKSSDDSMPYRTKRRSQSGPVSPKPNESDASPAENFTRELCEQNRSHIFSLGLVHAELSRRSIVYLMKFTNNLVTLDLSYAFVGIPAAQVIATALKMKNHSALTQLNLRGNRLKSMGTRALCKALHFNDRLTDVDVSRNNIDSDIVPDLRAMLLRNHTLVRIDLSYNRDVVAGTKESSREWDAFVFAMERHRALLSLGDLDSLHMSPTQYQTIDALTNVNKQRSNDLVLASVNGRKSFDSPHQASSQSMGRPLVDQSRTVTLFRRDSPSPEEAKVLWSPRRIMPGQARVSIKWTMKAFFSPNDKSDTRRHLPARARQFVSVCWQVIVRRRCDLAGAVSYHAAEGRCPLMQSTEGGFKLCSALVYCDEGDTISIMVSLRDENEDGEEDLADCGPVKVIGRDFVFLPHSLSLRHILLHFVADEDSSSRSLQWQSNPTRSPTVDSHNHFVNFAQVYIPCTATFRIVWRVRFISVAILKLDRIQVREFMEKQLAWFVLRSHCWDSEDQTAIWAGSTLELAGVVRGRDLAFCSPPFELMAGEFVQVRASSSTPEISLQLEQFFVFYETTSWENSLGDPCEQHG